MGSRVLRHNLVLIKDSLKLSTTGFAYYFDTNYYNMKSILDYRSNPSLRVLLKGLKSLNITFYEAYDIDDKLSQNEDLLLREVLGKRGFSKNEANHFKFIRYYYKYSSNDIAQILNIDSNTYLNIEKGNTSFSVKLLYDISKTYKSQPELMINYEYYLMK